MLIGCRRLANGSNLSGRAVNPCGTDPKFLKARLKRVQHLLETPRGAVHATWGRQEGLLLVTDEQRFKSKSIFRGVYKLEESTTHESRRSTRGGEGVGEDDIMCI